MNAGIAIAVEIGKTQLKLDDIYESDGPLNMNLLTALEDRLDMLLGQCHHVNINGDRVVADGICFTCGAPV